MAFEQASPARTRCWLVLPTRLVPDDADIPFKEQPKPFTLHAGRNEYECVQLVILSAQTMTDEDEAQARPRARGAA